ncbi:hypothetical protein EBS67_12925 [bacterium]|nr:hypothetical protein [bacterium]NBT62406.1 hypothetical protein [Planctomycetia bacterium]
MKKFYVSAFVFAAMTLPSFAQEKAAPAAKVVPEAKTTTTVVEDKRILSRFRRDSDAPKLSDRISDKLSNRTTSGFLANLRNR